MSARHNTRIITQADPEASSSPQKVQPSPMNALAGQMIEPQPNVTLRPKYVIRMQLMRR